MLSDSTWNRQTTLTDINDLLFVYEYQKKLEKVNKSKISTANQVKGSIGCYDDSQIIQVERAEQNNIVNLSCPQSFYLQIDLKDNFTEVLNKANEFRPHQQHTFYSPSSNSTFDNNYDPDYSSSSSNNDNNNNNDTKNDNSTNISNNNIAQNTNPGISYCVECSHLNADQKQFKVHAKHPIGGQFKYFCSYSSCGVSFVNSYLKQVHQRSCPKRFALFKFPIFSYYEVPEKDRHNNNIPMDNGKIIVVNDIDFEEVFPATVTKLKKKYEGALRKTISSEIQEELFQKETRKHLSSSHPNNEYNRLRKLEDLESNDIHVLRRPLSPISLFGFDGNLVKKYLDNCQRPLPRKLWIHCAKHFATLKEDGKLLFPLFSQLCASEEGQIYSIPDVVTGLDFSKLETPLFSGPDMIKHLLKLVKDTTYLKQMKLPDDFCSKNDVTVNGIITAVENIGLSNISLRHIWKSIGNENFQNNSYCLKQLKEFMRIEADKNEDIKKILNKVQASKLFVKKQNSTHKARSGDTFKYPTTKKMQQFILKMIKDEPELQSAIYGENFFVTSIKRGSDKHEVPLYGVLWPMVETYTRHLTYLLQVTPLKTQSFASSQKRSYSYKFDKLIVDSVAEAKLELLEKKKASSKPTRKVKFDFSHSNDDEVISGNIAKKIGQIDLKFNDLMTVTGRKWLNDEVLNAFIYLLNERINDDSHFVCSTFVSNELSKPNFNPKAMKRIYGRTFDVMSLSLLYIPVHSGDNHWWFMEVDFLTCVVTNLILSLLLRTNMPKRYLQIFLRILNCYLQLLLLV
jgi:hypothetical protein